MAEQRIYKSAYRGEVVPNEFTHKHPRLLSIKGSDFLVRRYKAGDTFRIESEVVRERSEALGHLREFGKFPGIHIPVYSGVITKDDFLNPVFDVVTERIEGVNLEDLRVFICPPRVVSELSELMVGLVEYSKYVFQNRKPYLYDQNLSQYVYGKGREGVLRPYFVDLGMETKRLPETTASHDANSSFFASFMPNIFSMIEELEKKTGTEFEEARIRLGTFLGTLPEGTGGRSYARDLMEEVLGRRFPEV